jgi:deoxyribose-phosphate aldolase
MTMTALKTVTTRSRLPDLSRVPAVDEVGVNERVARFQSRSIKKSSKVDALELILSMIDLTTLEGQDTPGKVRQLCQKRRCLRLSHDGWHRERSAGRNRY